MKSWEKVIERRLWKDISISDNQFGFIPVKVTIKAIYLLRRLIGLHRNRKAYDRILHEVIWRCF